MAGAFSTGKHLIHVVVKWPVSKRNAEMKRKGGISVAKMHLMG